MTANDGRRLVVGFIGLGDQGLPMAQAIIEGGFTFHVWARSPEVLDDPRLAGAVRAATTSELAAAVDVVSLCVSTDEVVLDPVSKWLRPRRGPGELPIRCRDTGASGTRHLDVSSAAGPVGA